MCMNDRVFRTLNELNISLQGSRITVALSGGADSVALCHFLWKNAGRLGICVAAAHLNHGLRGAESDADEAFVRDFCARLGIPLRCERLCLLPEEEPSEALLRKKRYAFLLRAAEAEGEWYLATGHTLSDSCETLLLHLARGTRLRGLRGIPVLRGHILRPFSDLCRADTESYCRENGLEYRTDSSNLTDLYARNRIRRQALPAMRSVNIRAEREMGALMREASQLYDWLDAEALAALQNASLAAAPGISAAETGPWAAAALAALPDVVLRQALARILSGSADCSAARLMLAARVVREGGAVDWCAGTRLRCADGTLRLERFDAAAERRRRSAVGDTAETGIPAAPGTHMLAPGLFVDIGELGPQPEFGAAAGATDEKSEKSRKINKKDLNNLLDYDKIISILSDTGLCCGLQPAQAVLRFRAPHDTYAPGRGRGTKSLKKWLNEIACPPAERGRLPLIAVGSRVVWLAGSGAAEGFAPTAASVRIWTVRVRDIKQGGIEP